METRSVVTAPTSGHLKGQALEALSLLAEHHLAVRVRWLPEEERGEPDLRYQVECVAFGCHFRMAGDTLEAAVFACERAVDERRRGMVTTRWPEQ